MFRLLVCHQVALGLSVSLRALERKDMEEQNVRDIPLKLNGWEVSFRSVKSS